MQICRTNQCGRYRAAMAQAWTPINNLILCLAKNCNRTPQNMVAKTSMIVRDGTFRRLTMPRKASAFFYRARL
jgi:hypothetical protein